MSCQGCNRPITDVYFEVQGAVRCEACRWEAERLRRAGTPANRVLRALVLGAMGGSIGAAVYYAVLAFTGYEVGFIAILVGFLVGSGVRWGSGGTGGRGYQWLAVAITYLSIVSCYVPFVLEAIMTTPEGEQAETVGDARVLAAEEELGASAEAAEVTFGTFVLAVAAIGLLAMAVPFLAGVQNIIGILILGVGLYEAWRVNAYQPWAVEGPFRLGDPP